MPDPAAVHQPPLQDQPTPKELADQSTPAPDTGPTSPIALGQASRYRAVSFHAEGGLGEVHVAVDTELDRSVALKRIQERYLGDALSRSRFLREATITARLEHPGIVPVHGLVTDEQGQPCYAMRFIEGESLAEAIKRFHKKPIAENAEDRGEKPSSLRASTLPAVDYSGLAFRQLLTRFLTVCNTLAYAHSRGVVHRDLKPQNIMLGNYGETLVVDWGLAKDLYDLRASSEPRTSASDKATTGPYTPPNTPDATQLGEALGTPEYMSPEQAAGRWDVLDHGTDIYSLGATLYELLTGNPPFERKDNWPALQQRIQQGKFLRPRVVNKNAPPALEAVCQKAMALEPQQRYRTAQDLAGDLEHWLADEPVSAYREPLRLIAWRWARRHRALVAGAAALLITTMLALALGLIVVEREREQTARQRDQKDEALQKEKQARELAMESLRSLTDEMVEKGMASKVQLTQDDREFLRSILKRFEQFASLPGDDLEQRAIRAEGHRRVALVLHRLGEEKEAESSYETALNLYEQLAAEFPRRPGLRQELAKIQNNLGHLYQHSGRVKQAEAVLGNALANLKQLPPDFVSAHPACRQNLGATHLNLGKILYDTGRFQGAEAEYGEALALAKQLVAESPGRHEFQFQQAMTHRELAWLYARQERLQEAERAYESALTILKQLPERPDYRKDLALTYCDLGTFCRVHDRLEQAEAAYRDALTIQKQLAADFPSRPDYRSNLALTHNNSAIVFQIGGRLQDAETAYADALTIFKELAAGFPKDSGYRNQIAGSMVNLAILARDRRDFAQACRWLRDATPHHTAALQINPRHPLYRDFYRNNLRELPRNCAGQGDQSAALLAATRLRDLGWDPPTNAYEAASALARCVTVVEKEYEADAVECKRQAQFYSDHAMGMLRDAIAKGYKNTTKLKTDKYLASLRGRDDFRKLLEELEGRAK